MLQRQALLDRARLALLSAHSLGHRACFDDAIAAADLGLDALALRQIEEIISDEVRVGGPSPESV